MIQTSLFPAIVCAILPFASQTQLRTIPVAFGLRVELPRAASEHLLDEVEQIFSPAGIRFDWRPADARAPVGVVLEARPSHPVITGCSRDLHDHRLGYTRLRDRRVTVWTEHVTRGAAGDWDSKNPPTLPDATLGRALGRVLAHELGHLFLGLAKHRSRGLMRSSFKHRQLRARSRRGLVFSGKDLEKIREGVKALFGDQPQ